MISIWRIYIFFVLFWQKCAYQGGENDRRAERFIKFGERHRVIKGHSNNKVIIHFGKPKFYYNLLFY